MSPLVFPITMRGRLTGHTRALIRNVGGYHFQAAMALLRPHGRIAVCGGISRYNENITYEPGTGPNTIMTTQMIYTFQRYTPDASYLYFRSQTIAKLPCFCV